MHALAVVVLCLTTFTPFTLGKCQQRNSTFYNPILPGFHPDPSCIFVPELDDTFFCASSSFNAFPGIPIHASKDLQNFKLIGHVLSRREQLPVLAETNRSTRCGSRNHDRLCFRHWLANKSCRSGIWAPTLRYHEGDFWLVTTLVDDELPQDDFSRWTNVSMTIPCEVADDG